MLIIQVLFIPPTILALQVPVLGRGRGGLPELPAGVEEGGPHSASWRGGEAAPEAGGAAWAPPPCSSRGPCSSAPASPRWRTATRGLPTAAADCSALRGETLESLIQWDFILYQVESIENDPIQTHLMYRVCGKLQIIILT